MVGEVVMIGLFARLVGRLGMRPKEAERFFKFLVVGSVGFVVDFGTLTFLVELLGWPPLVANTVSFSAAVVSNFIWNRLWTYPESRSKKKRVQLIQFGVVNVVGLMINNGLLIALQGPFDSLLMGMSLPIMVRGYVPAKIVATVVVLFWNFFVNRYWTYGDVDQVVTEGG